MKNTAPLSTPDQEQVAARVVGGDLGAELADARLDRILLDEDLADGLLELGLRHCPRSFHARTAFSQPGASTIPGTATTSSPETTSGHVSRSARGTFASTRTSCTFFERPASRSPGRRVRTIEAFPLALEAPRPEADATVEADRVVLADGTDAAPEVGGPSCRRSRRGALRASARDRRGRRGRSSASASRFRSAPGCSCRSSGRISSRISPRFVSAFDESTRYASPCLLAVRDRLLAPDVEERTNDAVLAPRLDRLRRPRGDEAVEHGLDLIRRRVPGRAQAGPAVSA